MVVVTASIERARWGECIRYGARTVLPKSTPLNTILATIRQIGEGRPVLAREERDRLVTCYRQEKVAVQEIRGRLDLLTSREREILAHLMTGRAVREIARESFVSEATVRTQVKSILAKLGGLLAARGGGRGTQGALAPTRAAQGRLTSPNCGMRGARPPFLRCSQPSESTAGTPGEGC